MASTASRRVLRAPKAGAARSTRAGRTTQLPQGLPFKPIVVPDRVPPVSSPDPGHTGSETGSGRAIDYRPITDIWILARPKVAFYGAYPNGFLERARALLGVGLDDPVLHVCGGRVRDYPGRGVGPNDKTLDLDPALDPDFLTDARLPFPLYLAEHGDEQYPGQPYEEDWAAVLADPPYTEDDAGHYEPGSGSLPDPSVILKHALEVVRVGGKVGILHYLIPRPPKNAKLIALIGVAMGFGNRIRAFTVFEKREAAK